jgi:hypothetical protein
MDERTTRYRILFARNTRTIVVWITTGLALSFTVLQLKYISIGDLIVPSASDLIWRVALIAYFWCWRFGCIFDTDIQELAYISLPGHGKWSLRSYGVVALLVIVAVLLCWTQGQVALFSLTLTAFFFVDHIGWRHLVRELDPEARNSAREFRRNRNYFALERLNIVRAQIQGNWKWWRMLAGSIVVVLIDLFAFSSSVRMLAVQSIQSLRPEISYQGAESFSYSFLVLTFVIVMEAWHYAIRLKTKISLNLIDDLSERYKLAQINSQAA